MKPNFALNLTDTGIGLLHRTSRGWMPVGEAAFDSPDLDEALGYLRSSALGLSPHGVTTKLVLPASQVLYLELEADGADRTTQRAQIAAALEGRTPYDVADLVFDWRGKGPVVKVAVVAKETLAEAEAFAVAHRFNPVSCVTIPGADQFGAEPFFGATDCAAGLLPEGETVTRDQDPVVVLNREAPKAELVADPAAEAEAARLAAERQAKAEERRREVEAQAALQKAEAAREAEAAEARRAAQAEAARRKAEAEATAAAEAASIAAEKAREQEAARREAERLEAAAADLAATEAARLEADRAKAALIAAEKLRLAATAQDIAEAEPEAASGKGPSLAFASRRRDEPEITAPKAKAPPAAAAKVAADKAGKAGSDTPIPVLAAALNAAKPEVTTAPAVITPSRTPDAVGSIRVDTPPPAPAKMAPVVVAPAGKSKALDNPAAGAGALKSPVAASPAKRLASMVTAASIPGKAARAATQDRPAGATTGAAGSAATMGSFGAKLQRQRGKPRFLGLALTLLLLVVLAMIAAWSSYYLSRDDDAAPAPTAVATATPEAPPATAPDTPDPEARADLDPEALADLQTEAVPEALAAEEPAPPPALTDDVSAGPDLPQNDAAGTLATTPGRDLQDEIMLATMDGPAPAFDAVALPAPLAVPDTAPQSAMPPPPAGTTYEFEADGSIRATPQEVITPDGVRLIAARPVPEPPPRPAAIAAPVAAAAPITAIQPAPAPDAPASGATALPEAALATGGFAPDAAIPQRRPPGRPASLDAAPPQQADDDAALAAQGDTRLTSLRPRLRPKELLARAEETRKATDAAAAAAAASLVAATSAEASVRTASALAVPISRRPAARPRDFSKAVSAAIAEATRVPEPKVTARAAEPEEEDEPEVKVKASAAPRIPTRASVAKQATFRNAINLSKINLIGVYGTANKRYALIRSSSGRYTKVKVGDRVDGGTVAAITSNELRYQKGGRMLALSMPKG